MSCCWFGCERRTNLAISLCAVFDTRENRPSRAVGCRVCLPTFWSHRVKVFVKCVGFGAIFCGHAVVASWSLCLLLQNPNGAAQQHETTTTTAVRNKPQEALPTSSSVPQNQALERHDKRQAIIRDAPVLKERERDRRATYRSVE